MPVLWQQICGAYLHLHCCKNAPTMTSRMSEGVEGVKKSQSRKVAYWWLRDAGLIENVANVLKKHMSGQRRMLRTKRAGSAPVLVSCWRVQLTFCFYDTALLYFAQQSQTLS